MLKKTSLLLVLLCMSLACHAQWPFNKNENEKDKKDKLKLYQSSRGIMLGYERGRVDMLQLGYHYNWKKIRLQKPVIHATEAYLDISPFEGVYGARAAYWQRQGRLKFTYGANLGYFTNFRESTLAIGPSVGIRILGIHGQAGYNLLSNPNVEANRLYVSLSVFFPQHTKISTKKGDKEKTILKW